MIVCVCRRVSDREILRHASEGKGFDDIQWELGVATECGRCEECAREVIDQCHAQAAGPARRHIPIQVAAMAMAM